MSRSEAMILFYVSVVITIFFAENCKTFNITNNDTESAPTIHIIEAWLRIPVRNIPYVNVMLRVQNHKQDAENPYIQWFLKQSLVPYTLSSYDSMNSSYIKSIHIRSTPDRGSYVIVTDMQKLRVTVSNFAQRSGTFFFVLTNRTEWLELRNICHDLWTNFRIVQNFILNTSGVFIYDPFAKNERGYYGQIIKYTGEYSLERTLFHNMRGYPLRVQIFQSVYSRPILNPVTNNIEYVHGLDGKVAEMLEKHMNFSMRLLEPDPDYFGQRLPNGSYNGAIGSILDNTVDICFTGFFVKDYLTRDISFSVAMYDDQLCIYTCKAERVPDYLLPIFAVHFNVWIGFIGIAFLASLVWTILRCLTLSLHIYNHRIQEKRLHQPLLWQYLIILKDTWVVWVRVCLNHYPVFESEKVLVLSLCLVSVIFGAIFECSLASSHIEPLYFKDINTLDELNKSGLPILYRHASMKDDLFAGETSPLLASLNNKTVYMPDRRYNILKEIIDKGRTTGVNRYNSLMLESLDVLVTKQIWIIPEFPKHYTIAYVWLRDAPWEETLNNLLLRFLQAGVIFKFQRDMKIEAEINLMKQHLYEASLGFRILTVRDLQLAFYVVIIGNVMSVITLIVERLYFAYRLRRNST